EVALVIGEPALMRVCDVGVARARECNRIRLVGNVGDAQRGLIRTEADFAAGIPLVRPAVDDALRVVRVAGAGATGERVREAAREFWRPWFANVDHVEPTATRLPTRA